jgi:hypothetical protein
MISLRLYKICHLALQSCRNFRLFISRDIVLLEILYLAMNVDRLGVVKGTLLLDLAPSCTWAVSSVLSTRAILFLSGAYLRHAR